MNPAETSANVLMTPVAWELGIGNWDLTPGRVSEEDAARQPYFTGLGFSTYCVR